MSRPRLTPLPPEDEVAQWVTAELNRADDTPRRVNWRYRAQGMTMAAAMAQVERNRRIELKVPVTYYRQIRHAAHRRGLSINAYLRLALDTLLERDEHYGR